MTSAHFMHVMRECAENKEKELKSLVWEPDQKADTVVLIQSGHVIAATDTVAYVPAIFATGVCDVGVCLCDRLSVLSTSLTRLVLLPASP